MWPWGKINRLHVLVIRSILMPHWIPVTGIYLKHRSGGLKATIACMQNKVKRSNHYWPWHCAPPIMSLLTKLIYLIYHYCFEAVAAVNDICWDMVCMDKLSKIKLVHCIKVYLRWDPLLALMSRIYPLLETWIPNLKQLHLILDCWEPLPHGMHGKTPKPNIMFVG